MIEGITITSENIHEVFKKAIKALKESKVIHYEPTWKGIPIYMLEGELLQEYLDYCRQNLKLYD